MKLAEINNKPNTPVWLVKSGSAEPCSPLVMAYVAATVDKMVGKCLGNMMSKS